eukprot:2495586-Alexandrium_andersonii.AAC.1
MAFLNSQASVCTETPRAEGNCPTEREELPWKGPYWSSKTMRSSSQEVPSDAGGAGRPLKDVRKLSKEDEAPPSLLKTLRCSASRSGQAGGNVHKDLAKERLFRTVANAISLLLELD